jgi:hypothetical protein
MYRMEDTASSHMSILVKNVLLDKGPQFSADVESSDPAVALCFLSPICVSKLYVNLSYKNKYFYGAPVAHTKPQFLIRRDHLMATVQRSIQLKSDRPCRICGYKEETSHNC